MLCILVFIIFLILFPIFGIFSKDYRILFKKAWECAFKKVTLKPCDVNFGDEVKNRVLSKIAFRFPRVAKFIDKTSTIWALAFVLLSVWSLLYVVNAGLNLWVYDTCDPVTGESCALGGEACGVGTNSAPTILETLSRVPDRLRSWNAKEFTTSRSSYYNSFDLNKPVAIEVIDPGCQFCKKLWANIKEAGFENTYNLTYLAYPIPDVNGGHKFQHSYLITSYLEAIKLVPSSNSKSDIPADWRLLDKIFTSEVENTDLQNAINTLFSEEEVITLINEFLTEFGYTEEEISSVNELVGSDQVKSYVKENIDIVEKDIKTIKIPTIIFDGRRYDRVVDVETLRR